MGLLLPLLLYATAGVRVTAGLAPWVVLDSVSSYYYTGAIGFFVGIIFALALFLASYRGYTGEVIDSALGVLGGVAAICVALFPTAAPLAWMAPSWWKGWMETFHLWSAVVMFTVFFLFAVWLFPKSSIPAWSARPPEKRRRDAISYVCGAMIAIGMAWAAIRRNAGEPIFIQETIAIEGFAISWLTKGMAHQPFVRWYRAVTSK